MVKDTSKGGGGGDGCGCWFLSIFAPVSAPPCQPKKGFLNFRKCNLPALQPGISSSCPFKPILAICHIWVEFLRRFFLPSASAFVVYAKSNDDNKTKKDGKKDDKKDKDGKNKKDAKKDEKETKPDCEKLIKAVDLPLYSDYKGNRKDNQAINENSVLITTIRCMRQELCFFMEQVEVVKQELSEVYLKGKAHTQQTIEYLRDPDNVYPRAGAISAGALTGYLLAIRKGKFKKLVFMGAGAGAVSAILYPQEAQYYCEEALKVMKKYVIIAYHFFNGDFAAGKPIMYETPKRTKKYVPSKLQQEFLDIQSKMEGSACTCKTDDKKDEKDDENDKKKGK